MSTAEQRHSLRLYQGSINEYEMNTVEDSKKYMSSFYAKKSAYNVLNMLLCPGVDSEYTRIVLEKKRIPFGILEDIEEILCIYEDIFAVMCEERQKGTKNQYVYRVDRMQSMEMLTAGYTFGFTSCSSNQESGTEDAQLRKKDGILLLEWKVPSGVPYVLMNNVLGRNAFCYQNELLIPPFTTFRNNGRIPLTMKEMEYQDINGQPPKAKYQLEVTGMNLEHDREDIKVISEKNEIGFVIGVLEKMERGIDISEEEKKKYSIWKTRLQSVVKDSFVRIYQGEE